ncbi:MAG: hypothetical protein M1837_005342 [Sclerophora amabilis]|nr:MAG: hypothetical protein M1837_005342 [Sclerophora amabilis]
MRWSRSTSPNSQRILSALFLLSPTLVSGTNVQCDHIVVDKTSFNLSPLEGRHSVWDVTDHEPTKVNTTYTINPCNKLRRTKGVSKENECQNGAHVCAIEHLVHEDGHLDDDPIGIKVIAGDFPTSHGWDLDAQWTRLSTSSSNADSQKEGLRLELHGGRYPFKKSGKKQKAIVEFLCDKGRTGLEEGSSVTDGKDDDDGEDEEEEEEEAKRIRRAGDEDKGEDEDGDGDDKKDTEDTKSLRFISYKTGEDEDTLRLEWRTKHACEGQKDEEDAAKSGHWGFFTWFIIM